MENDWIDEKLNTVKYPISETMHGDTQSNIAINAVIDAIENVGYTDTFKHLEVAVNLIVEMTLAPARQYCMFPTPGFTEADRREFLMGMAVNGLDILDLIGQYIYTDAEKEIVQRLATKELFYLTGRTN